MSIVYVNGEYLPINEAKISIMDRGFLFADAVYEVIGIHRNTPIGLNEHIDRLNKSLQAILINPPYSLEEWKNIFHQLLKKNPEHSEELGCYIQVSRGAQATRTVDIPAHLSPTIVAFLTKSTSSSVNSLLQGFKVVTMEDPRHRDNYIKTTGKLPSLLAYHEAKKQGAIEVIFIRNGLALECSSSNFFLVKNNILMTSPLTPTILGGITRDLILKLAKANHILTEEKETSLDLLHSADEIWITSSTRDIFPITMLDGQSVGTGTVGPLWHKMI